MEPSPACQFEINNENNYYEMLSDLRRTFGSGITKNLEYRKKQLKSLLRVVKEGQNEILAAQWKDFRNNSYSAQLSDVSPATVDIEAMLRHLKEYARDERLPYNPSTPMDVGYVRKEPLGVVLIIGTWNVPIQTCIQPLAGAIAAGNCAIVKPSELAPFCADVMAKLIEKYLDPNCYRVVQGDVEVSKNLLKNKFDHIFFTGSTSVGKCILQAAVPHLTPVTLELGGINPCFIDASADYEEATKRILWGKLALNGQACVSPGYVMCSAEIQDVIVKYIKIFLKEFYGENPKESPDIPRIVNRQNFNRIKKLLESTQGGIAIGGSMDEDDLWIEPTVVVNVCPQKDSLMQEEIFGPILPIIVVSSVDDAVRIILSKPKPLASYIFSNDDSVTKKYIQSTSSGTTGINDTIMQEIRPGLPFGGVGESGMGNYHGKASFVTFSHKRAILKTSQDIFSNIIYNLRYPPHSNFKVGVLRWYAEHVEMMFVPTGAIFSHLLAALIGAFFLYVLGFRHLG